MKKLFFLILSLILVVSMMPVSVVATESTSERDELIARACEAFPEYEAIICNENTSTYSRSNIDNPEITFCETRSISEHERITYAQLSSNGAIIIDETVEAIELIETDSSISNFSAGVRGTLSYKVICTNEYYNGIFYLNDFEYTIYDSAYDWITNDGTMTCNDSVDCAFSQGSTVYQETANNAARASYGLRFIHQGAYGVQSSRDLLYSLILSVRNNTVNITLY